MVVIAAVAEQSSGPDRVEHESDRVDGSFWTYGHVRLGTGNYKLNMRPQAAISGARTDRPTYRWRVAMASGIIAFAISSGAALARTTRATAGPKPPAEVMAHRMRPRAGFPVPRLGARIPASDLAGQRVFANAQVGFALSGNDDGNASWSHNQRRQDMDN